LTEGVASGCRRRLAKLDRSQYGSVSRPDGVPLGAAPLTVDGKVASGCWRRLAKLDRRQ
jgi:hypothetical protein